MQTFHSSSLDLNVVHLTTTSLDLVDSIQTLCATISSKCLKNHINVHSKWRESWKIALG